MAQLAEQARLNALPRTLAGMPKLLIGGLLLTAICVMILGVLLRYVVAPITDMLDIDPISFFWVEEVGELLLAWLTLVGAAVGIAERTHFTVDLLVQYVSPAARRTIHVVNHIIIAGFGGVIAWQGWVVAGMNTGLTSPALGIDMGWLYGALVAGGVLIALFAVATPFVPVPAPPTIVE